MTSGVQNVLFQVCPSLARTEEVSRKSCCCCRGLVLLPWRFFLFFRLHHSPAPFSLTSWCHAAAPVLQIAIAGSISFENPYGYLPGRFYGYLPFEVGTQPYHLYPELDVPVSS